MTISEIICFLTLELIASFNNRENGLCSDISNFRFSDSNFYQLMLLTSFQPKEAIYFLSIIDSLIFF